MYVLLLQKVFIPTTDNLNDDGHTPKEAVMRSENIQDLVHVLDNLAISPYHELGTQVERFFIEGSVLFDHKRPPSGDYLKTGTIIDMTTLEQRIHEVVDVAEKKTIAEWENLVANTVDAAITVKFIRPKQPKEKNNA